MPYLRAHQVARGYLLCDQKCPKCVVLGWAAKVLLGLLIFKQYNTEIQFTINLNLQRTMSQKFTFAAMFSTLRIIPLVIVITTLVSCSGYQKVVKSTDYEKKYEVAKIYYEKEDYQKAFTLFEELLTVYRGTSKGESVYFYYSYCQFGLRDYLLASYHFNNFAKTFPKSEHAEECMFMGAKCYFLDSSDPSLDQASTEKAISEMQIFINKYPKSKRVEECNELMDRLRFKLEQKDYNAAKLYFDMEDYKSAIVALRNVLNDYPESRFREEMSFMVVRSSYLLAKNSIEKKKQKRYEDAIQECRAFVEKYPENRYRKEVDGIFAASNKALAKLTASN